jgi:hypothetical protein
MGKISLNVSVESINKSCIYLPFIFWDVNFFPNYDWYFSILADDNEIFICTRKKTNGRKINTPHNNSLLGAYFRYRLGLKDGAFVTKQDLERYGRTDIDFYKIDEENYFMDFSNKSNN